MTSPLLTTEVCLIFTWLRCKQHIPQSPVETAGALSCHVEPMLIRPTKTPAHHPTCACRSCDWWKHPCLAVIQLLCGVNRVRDGRAGGGVIHVKPPGHHVVELVVRCRSIR